MLIEAYYRKDDSFSVFADGISSRLGEVVPLKVDTGSPYTVISYETMYPDDETKSRKKHLLKYFDQTQIKPICPHSASGHTLACYPIILNNISFGEDKLREFPVYLVMNLNRKLSLLGLDFLNFCEIHHPRSSDVMSLDFENEAAYKQFFLNRYNASILSLDGILNEIGSAL